METRHLKIAEFAERFAVSDETVLSWVKQGHVRAVRIGGTTRIPRAELARIEGDVA